MQRASSPSAGGGAVDGDSNVDAAIVNGGSKTATAAGAGTTFAFIGRDHSNNADCHPSGTGRPLEFGLGSSAGKVNAAANASVSGTSPAAQKKPPPPQSAKRSRQLVVDTTAPPLGSPGGLPPSGRAQSSPRKKKKRKAGPDTPQDAMHREAGRARKERSRSGQKLSDEYIRYKEETGQDIQRREWMKKYFLGATTSRSVRIARVKRGWTAVEAYTGLPAEPTGRREVDETQAELKVDAHISGGATATASPASSTPGGQNGLPTAFKSEEEKQKVLNMLGSVSAEKRKVRSGQMEVLQGANKVAEEGLRIAEGTSIRQDEVAELAMADLDEFQDTYLQVVATPVSTPVGMPTARLAFEDEDEAEDEDG